ncbi:hypothetical protein ACIPW5_16215 [Streptomyces sp. NPDC090077]|uniref:hypothetical protein n=1 Tax=Streptomyces sp. NPDC090077 TaxID=3365938 RepID=UPI00381C99F9
MPSRRTLPPSLSLLLAVLVGATGCVTVRAPERTPGPAPVRTAWAPPAPVVGGLPLGPVPDPVETSAPPVEAAAPAAPPPAAPQRPAPRSDDRPPRRASPVRPARPAHRAPAAKPAGPATPRKQRQPAPQRSYDMSGLCRAAHGVVDPAIVAMCR